MLPLLSVIMIVKNEEQELSHCLECVKGLADEILIVDTGSTDNTVAIARACGAKVISDPWQDDFSRARNRSIEEASGQWLLWLDADDRLADIEHGKIRRLLHGDPAAYLFIIENLYEGRKAQEFRQVRLFPKRKDIRFQGKIHESLTPTVAQSGLPVKTCEIRITHTGYSDAEKRREKVRRNLTLLTEEYHRFPHDPAVIMELGHTHFQLKDYASALKLYQEILALPDGEKTQQDVFRSVPIFIGTAYYEMRDYENAKIWFRRSVERFPEKIAAYYYLGRIALDEKDVTAVKAMFQLVILKEPDISTVASDYTGMKANAYAYIANLHFVRGEFEEALKLYIESEEKLGYAAYQYASAGYAALKAQNLSRAVYFLAKAEAAGELSAEGLSDFGVVLWGIARRDRAVMKWEEAMEKDPHCISAQNNYVDAIFELKEYSRGSDFLRKIIDQIGDAPTLRFFRANMLKSQGDRLGARLEAEAILARHPENSGARDFLKTL